MKKMVNLICFYIIICTQLLFLMGCKSTPSSDQNIFSGTYAYDENNYFTFTDNVFFGSWGYGRQHGSYSGTFLVEDDQIILYWEISKNKWNWKIINKERIRDHQGKIWYRQSERQHREAVQQQYEKKQRQQREAEQRKQDHEAMLRQRGITEEQWQVEQGEIWHRELQARQEQDALSKLIQNTLDIGFNVGQSFRTGEIVAIPFGLFSILDYSFENSYHSYLVIMNDYSVQYKPFYIESDRRLDSIGQMRVQYVGTAQYLSGRVPRDTLRFREIR